MASAHCCAPSSLDPRPSRSWAISMLHGGGTKTGTRATTQLWTMSSQGGCHRRTSNFPVGRSATPGSTHMDHSAPS
eukprot:1911958-Rhodomonas_salina.1